MQDRSERRSYPWVSYGRFGMKQRNWHCVLQYNDIDMVNRGAQMSWKLKRNFLDEEKEGNVEAWAGRKPRVGRKQRSHPSTGILHHKMKTNWTRSKNQSSESQVRWVPGGHGVWRVLCSNGSRQGVNGSIYKEAVHWKQAVFQKG